MHLVVWRQMISEATPTYLKFPRPCVAIGLQGRSSMVRRRSDDLTQLEQIYEKIAHLIGSSTLQRYTDNMNIEFYSWVQILWIILAKNAQVKTLEANEYVGGLAHFIMDFIPLQSISRGGLKGSKLDQLGWSKASVFFFGLAFALNIGLNNFSLSLVAISPLGKVRGCNLGAMIDCEFDHPKGCWNFDVCSLRACFDGFVKCVAYSPHSNKAWTQWQTCPPCRGLIWSSDHVCHCRQFGA